MGCCLAVIALIIPRILMIFIALLTNWFSYGFETRIWPVLGFFFMPYATLAYLAAMLNNNHTLSGGWLALFIIAIIIDAGQCGCGKFKYKRK